MLTTYGLISDCGRTRAANEDRVFADRHRGVYVVSDGMGGLPHGAAAAQHVVDCLPDMITAALRGVADLSAPVATAKVLSAVCELNQQVLRADRAEGGSMGATFVLAVLRGAHALIAHLGDSRAYLYRLGTLTRLTTDHTVAELLLQNGEIDPLDAAVHPGRALLTRYIGMSGPLAPEIHLVELVPADRLLLCSDGLTGMISERQIRAIMGAELDPSQACQHLVSAANAAGGADNISVVTVNRERHRA